MFERNLVADLLSQSHVCPISANFKLRQVYVMITSSVQTFGVIHQKTALGPTGHLFPLNYSQGLCVQQINIDLTFILTL